MERVDVEQRAEKARRFFLEGYNCAQAVVLAYCDLFDISPSLAASISAPLGGGMGRLREVCGAVSGMFMVAGLFYKNDIPSDMTKRKIVYSTVQDLAEKSKALNGSIIAESCWDSTIKAIVLLPRLVPKRITSVALVPIM